MDGKGRWPPSHGWLANHCRATDNRMIVRLWRFLKYECIYLNAFGTGSETRAGIEKWIAYDNAERPHTTHGILTPNEAYDRKMEPMSSAA
jgi:putative transposase